MLLSFELSMPNNNAWNGKWTGEGNFYARVVNFGKTKKAEAKAREILDNRYFHYSFRDGWSAGVTVKEVDAKTAMKIRRKSKGFYSYDWMIDSIRRDMTITSPSERREYGRNNQNAQEV